MNFLKWLKKVLKFSWVSKPLHASEGPEATKEKVMDTFKPKVEEDIGLPTIKVPPVRRLELNRENDYLMLNRQTPGEFSVKEGSMVLFSCKSIELPWLNNSQSISCIPKMTYWCEKRISEKYGEHIHVLDVPGREWILIHVANWVSQLRGCIAPGLDFKDLDNDGLKDVVYSKKALNKLLSLLPHRFQLTIY